MDREIDKEMNKEIARLIMLAPLLKYNVEDIIASYSANINAEGAITLCYSEDYDIDMFREYCGTGKCGGCNQEGCKSCLRSQELSDLFEDEDIMISDIRSREDNYELYE